MKIESQSIKQAKNDKEKQYKRQIKFKTEGTKKSQKGNHNKHN